MKYSISWVQLNIMFMIDTLAYIHRSKFEKEKVVLKLSLTIWTLWNFLLVNSIICNLELISDYYMLLSSLVFCVFWHEANPP